MFKWSLIKNFDTTHFSDSTEISPNGKFSINCCYQLNETSGVREGSFSLINIETDDCEIVSEMKNTDGILDCSWTNDDSFVLAGATGKLYFYNYNNHSLNNIRTIEVNTDSICLSVDAFGDKVLCTTSKGDLFVLDEKNERNILFNEKVNDYEAWVGHLSRHDKNIFYCGGDDCIFKGIDVRCKKKNIFSKRFEMGITSIGSHPKNENILSMGSYDEHLHAWDIRNMRQEIINVDVGGGVWRHKWCPQGNSLVLIAGMYAGFAMVNTEDSSVLRQPFDIHNNGLGYGADWFMRGQDYIITLSSFYNHQWSLSKLTTLDHI